MNTLVTAMVSSGFSTAVVLAVINYLRDRRSLNTKNTVAEQIAPEQVDAARLANMERRLGLVEKAHDAEVEALQETIKNLRDRLDAATGRITLLEQRIEFEDGRYREAIRYVRRLRGWIANHVPGVDPPTIPPALEVDFQD